MNQKNTSYFFCSESSALPPSGQVTAYRVPTGEAL